MKKLILLIGLSVILVGCSTKVSDRLVYDYDSKTISTTQTSQNTEIIQTTGARFVETGNMYKLMGFSWVEILDTLTGNLYIGNPAGYKAGLSPLYDENGEIMNINKMEEYK